MSESISGKMTTDNPQASLPCTRLQMLIIFPMVAISTLSTIIYASSSSARKENESSSITGKGYQITLLLCMLLAHGIIVTSNTGEGCQNHNTTNDNLTQNIGGDHELRELMTISYMPILLSIIDAFTFSARPWKRVGNPLQIICRTKTKQTASSSTAQIFSLKMFVRSSIPSFLILIYATIVMRAMHPNEYQEDKDFWKITCFVTSWAFCTLWTVTKKAETLWRKRQRIWTN